MKWARTSKRKSITSCLNNTSTSTVKSIFTSSFHRWWHTRSDMIIQKWNNTCSGGRKMHSIASCLCSRRSDLKTERGISETLSRPLSYVRCECVNGSLFQSVSDRSLCSKECWGTHASSCSSGLVMKGPERSERGHASESTAMKSKSELGRAVPYTLHSQTWWDYIIEWMNTLPWAPQIEIKNIGCYTRRQVR
jgi:hypothetical protein